jgi:hypothetical protein
MQLKKNKLSLNLLFVLVNEKLSHISWTCNGFSLIRYVHRCWQSWKCFFRLMFLSELKILLYTYNRSDFQVAATSEKFEVEIVGNGQRWLDLKSSSPSLGEEMCLRLKNIRRAKGKDKTSSSCSKIDFSRHDLKENERLGREKRRFMRDTKT